MHVGHTLKMGTGTDTALENAYSMSTNYSSGEPSSIPKYGEITKSERNVRRNRSDGGTTDARQQRCGARYPRIHVERSSDQRPALQSILTPPSNQRMVRVPYTTYTTTTITTNTTASSMKRWHANQGKPEPAMGGETFCFGFEGSGLTEPASHQPASSVSPEGDTPPRRLRATTYG